MDKNPWSLVFVRVVEIVVVAQSAEAEVLVAEPISQLDVIA